VQDTKLFETILGLQAPWHIARVELEPTTQRVELWAEHDTTRWPCPECQQLLPCADHADERTWRHLDTCQFQTHLHARVPRVQCPTHGVKQVRVPWAEPRARFTQLMERLIIDVIRQCSTLVGACRILQITWDEAWGVMDRAVTRGRARKVARPIRYLGVDEKAFRKGHVYHTIVCDLERSTVEHVAEDRRVESLGTFFEHLAPAQREAIKAVAMDMWDPYIRATREGLVDGETRVVFDRFHIMRELTTAVDRVRKQEHRTLRGTDGASVLSGSKYLWLYSQERLPQKHAARFADLQALNLKVGRAWAIKEALRTLWSYTDSTEARRFFQRWFLGRGAASSSRCARRRRRSNAMRKGSSGIVSIPSPTARPKASTARS
jgi:transposase